MDDREEPLWVGRAMDAPGAAITSFLSADSIVPYPETHVDSDERQPAAFLAAEIAKRGGEADASGSSSIAGILQLIGNAKSCCQAR